MEDEMDLPTAVNLFFSIMVLLCVALFVYGGWMSLIEAQSDGEKAHRTGTQPAGAILPLQPDTYRVAAGLAIPAPAGRTGLEVKLLYVCLALAGIGYALVLLKDVIPAGSPVSSAAATEATRRTVAGRPAAREVAATPAGASLDYFPASYVNQGRDGDGNVLTYEHD
jgi:hypothetical protein